MKDKKNKKMYFKKLKICAMLLTVTIDVITKKKYAIKPFSNKNKKQ